MPPKRFEGKFGIPPSHPVESLLTQALYRLPESISPEYIENLTREIATAVDAHRTEASEPVLSESERHALQLKLARHYEDNGESAHIDIPTFIDALVESPKFLQIDKGSIAKLFEIHEMKTLQKIAELRRKRAEITSGDTSELNPYENLFETESGNHYLARLLNMPHLEEESEYMSHCVGTSTSYVNKMKKGDVEIFSFRTKETHAPLVTIEYDTRAKRLLQVKAYDDRIPTLDDAIAPDLLEVLSRLPETVNDSGEHREVKSNEVTHLTRLLEIQEKANASTDLTRDDLLFLYEVHEPIQGFDSYAREPLIDTLLAVRDRREDIRTMANCTPEHLTTIFTELTEDTEVYVEDTGTKLTLIDFREAQYQAKLPHLLELVQKLKETGSLAIPDLSFEGGIVTIQYSPEMVQSKAIAFEQFEDADGHSPSYIWPEWRKGEWVPPTGERLDIVVLSYNADPATRQSSDKIVADMDRLGLRPLTLEEMTIAGIAEPKFTKTSNKCFVGLTKYARVGRSCVPNLWRDGSLRILGRDWWVGDWDEHCRFLCVRK